MEQGKADTEAGVSGRFILFPSAAVPDYAALIHLSEYILR